MSKKNLCIFGAGGAARDALAVAEALERLEEIDCFLESDDLWTERKVKNIDVKPLSHFDFKKHKIIIALGDSEARKKIADMLPLETRYFSLIHPTAILSPWVEIGEGSIVCAGAIFTYDIKIGRHAYINVASTITHECRIGDFFTAAPSVNLSGNCTIGDCVFIGTNASVREKTSIADNIIVGMGSVVLNDLKEPGVYAGVPAKRLLR